MRPPCLRPSTGQQTRPWANGEGSCRGRDYGRRFSAADSGTVFLDRLARCRSVPAGAPWIWKQTGISRFRLLELEGQIANPRPSIDSLSGGCPARSGRNDAIELTQAMAWRSSGDSGPWWTLFRERVCLRTALAKELDGFVSTPLKLPFSSAVG